MFSMLMQNVYNVNKEILHFYISFTFITFSAKKRPIQMYQSLVFISLIKRQFQ